MDVCEFARQLRIQVCRRFDPQLLVPQEKIREYCRQNRCGNYGRNHMCPPLVSPLDEIQARLRKYQQAVLLQSTSCLDVKNDPAAVRQSLLDFQAKVLAVEEFLKGQEIRDVWGISAGHCGLCQVCSAVSGKPCLHPDKARASMEASGLDVMGLLTRLGLDNQFHSDRINWTGCILF